jgi:hypothetical protein
MDNCKWTATGDIECSIAQQKTEPSIVFKSVLINHPLQEMNLKEQVLNSIEYFDENAFIKLKNNIKKIAKN